MRLWSLRLLILVVGLLLGFYLLVRFINFNPPEHMPLIVQGSGEPMTLRQGEPIELVSWNLQYCASRKHHFWYDGGQAVIVPKSDVLATLDAVSGLLRERSPHLALLQEVDRDSNRTHRIDQLPPLVQAMGANRWVSASYHNSIFVPTPSHQMMGRVDMNLAILSRLPMGPRAQRLQLPKLQENFLRRAFNLKRALLWSEIPIEGQDKPLAVAVTHLSAFSRGDGTMQRQVQVLDGWMKEREELGQPFVLAGDMNLLPPGDDPSRLGEDSALYSDQSNPITSLVPAHRTAFPPRAMLDPSNFTYLPFGATEPDRKIDYIFVGPGVQVLDAQVLRQYTEVSDHLPLAITFSLPGRSPGPSSGQAAPPSEPAGVDIP